MTLSKGVWNCLVIYIIIDVLGDAVSTAFKYKGNFSVETLKAMVYFEGLLLVLTVAVFIIGLTLYIKSEYKKENEA